MKTILFLIIMSLSGHLYSQGWVKGKDITKKEKDTLLSKIDKATSVDSLPIIPIIMEGSRRGTNGIVYRWINSIDEISEKPVQKKESIKLPANAKIIIYRLHDERSFFLGTALLSPLLDSISYFISLNDVYTYAKRGLSYDVYLAYCKKYELLIKREEYKRLELQRRLQRERDSLYNIKIEQSKIAERIKMDSLQVAEEEQRLEWESNMLKKYGKVNGNIIIDHDVRLGFTKQMCRDAWGEPDEITSYMVGKVLHEDWIYHRIVIRSDGGGTDAQWLSFEGDKLTIMHK
jgi:hypothetical protein